MNLQRVIRHVKFCIHLYNIQMDGGRYFVHEPPWSAKSWELEQMQVLLNDLRVQRVQTHMCRFGMESDIDSKDGPKGPVKKPTGFASNSWAILRALGKLCNDKTHQHVPLMGARAAGAAIYPGRLCAAICKGFKFQMNYDKRGLVCTVGMTATQTKSRILAMLTETYFMERLGRLFFPHHWRNIYTGPGTLYWVQWEVAYHC